MNIINQITGSFIERTLQRIWLSAFVDDWVWITDCISSDGYEWYLKKVLYN